MDLTDYIPLSEYARLQGLAESSVRRKILRGNLPGAVKLGRNWLIPKGEPYIDKRRKSMDYLVFDVSIKCSAELLSGHSVQDIIAAATDEHRREIGRFDTREEAISFASEQGDGSVRIEGDSAYITATTVNGMDVDITGYDEDDGGLYPEVYVSRIV